MITQYIDRRRERRMLMYKTGGHDLARHIGINSTTNDDFDYSLMATGEHMRRGKSWESATRPIVIIFAF